MKKMNAKDYVDDLMKNGRMSAGLWSVVMRYLSEQESINKNEMSLIELANLSDLELLKIKRMGYKRLKEFRELFKDFRADYTKEELESAAKKLKYYCKSRASCGLDGCIFYDELTSTCKISEDDSESGVNPNNWRV